MRTNAKGLNPFLPQLLRAHVVELTRRVDEFNKV